MRRAAPWISVGFLALGAGLGAGLGVAMQPGADSSRALLQSIFATTEAAGSARFTFTLVTTSSNRLLRSRTAGFGVIDFRARDSEIRAVERGVGLSGTGGGPDRPVPERSVNVQERIGNAWYMRLDLPEGFPGSAWIKLPGQAGRGIGGIVGVLDQTTAYGAIPGAPDLALQWSQSSPFAPGGASRYTFVSMPACRVVTSKRGVQWSPGSLEIWVDAAGRLVEAKTSLAETSPLGALPGLAENAFAGTSHTTSTLHLFDFGAPVRLSVPKVGRFGFGTASVGGGVIGLPALNWGA